MIASIVRVVGSGGGICLSEDTGDGKGGGLICDGSASGSPESMWEDEAVGGIGGRGSSTVSMLRDRTSTNCRPVM